VTERIAEDPTTGGKKGVKPEQLGDVDPNALMELARVAGVGHDEYGQYNYLKGFPFSWSYNAMQRHVNAYWAGEDIDPKSGLHHLAHAAWHCLALTAYYQRGVGTDDRPPRGKAEEKEEELTETMEVSKHLSPEQRADLQRKIDYWTQYVSPHPKREVPYA
jgi:hypothetical protein